MDARRICGRWHKLVRCQGCGELVWARWQRGRSDGRAKELRRRFPGEPEPAQEQPVLLGLYRCDECVPWEIAAGD